MGKKKKEHITFDRMADKYIRINKQAFINSKISKKIKHTSENHQN